MFAARGRTDAGAHALAQVCHLHTTSRLELSSLWRAVNSRLPASIRVTGIETAAADSTHAAMPEPNTIVIES